jgi:hypothetical protein
MWRSWRATRRQWRRLDLDHEDEWNRSEAVDVSGRNECSGAGGQLMATSTPVLPITGLSTPFNGYGATSTAHYRPHSYIAVRDLTRTVDRADNRSSDDRPKMDSNSPILMFLNSHL